MDSPIHTMRKNSAQRTNYGPEIFKRSHSGKKLKHRSSSSDLISRLEDQLKNTESQILTGSLNIPIRSEPSPHRSTSPTLSTSPSASQVRQLSPYKTNSRSGSPSPQRLGSRRGSRHNSRSGSKISRPSSRSSTVSSPGSIDEEPQSMTPGQTRKVKLRFKSAWTTFKELEERSQLKGSYKTELQKLIEKSDEESKSLESPRRTGKIVIPEVFSGEGPRIGPGGKIIGRGIRGEVLRVGRLTGLAKTQNIGTDIKTNTESNQIRECPSEETNNQEEKLVKQQGEEGEVKEYKLNETIREGNSLQNGFSLEGIEEKSVELKIIGWEQVLQKIKENVEQRDIVKTARLHKTPRPNLLGSLSDEYRALVEQNIAQITVMRQEIKTFYLKYRDDTFQHARVLIIIDQQGKILDFNHHIYPVPGRLPSIKDDIVFESWYKTNSMFQRTIKNNAKVWEFAKDSGLSYFSVKRNFEPNTTNPWTILELAFFLSEKYVPPRNIISASTSFTTPPPNPSTIIPPPFEISPSPSSELSINSSDSNSNNGNSNSDKNRLSPSNSLEIQINTSEEEQEPEKIVQSKSSESISQCTSTQYSSEDETSYDSYDSEYYNSEDSDFESGEDEEIERELTEQDINDYVMIVPYNELCFPLDRKQLLVLEATLNQVNKKSCRIPYFDLMTPLIVCPYVFILLKWQRDIERSSLLQNPISGSISPGLSKIPSNRSSLIVGSSSTGGRMFHGMYRRNYKKRVKFYLSIAQPYLTQLYEHAQAPTNLGLRGMLIPSEWEFEA